MEEIEITEELSLILIKLFFQNNILDKDIENKNITIKLEFTDMNEIGWGLRLFKGN